MKSGQIATKQISYFWVGDFWRWEMILGGWDIILEVIEVLVICVVSHMA